MTELHIIRWGDLGSPTGPCVVNFRGCIVDVKQKNVDASKGNPDAVFTATKISPWAAPAHYVLGSVKLPKAT